MSDGVAKTCFLVPNYGSAFEGMLLACLESVARAAPGMCVYVAWQDMDGDKVAALQKAYPASRWVKTAFAVSKDYVVRISAKTRLAEVAAKAALADGFTQFVLMDSDILMRAGVTDAFAEDFDVGFTSKSERWPLNSGVIFLKGAKTLDFLRVWSAESARIGSSPELLAEASSKALPYGGIDQMALHLMTDFDRGRKGVYERDGFRYKALPCALYNETRSLPLICAARLIHYKGGWHRILTKGSFYTAKRPMGDSLEMHRFYLETALGGLRRVNQAAARDWSLAAWNLRLPPYLDAGTLELCPMRVLFERAKQPFQFGWRAAKALLRRLPRG